MIALIIGGMVFWAIYAAIGTFFYNRNIIQSLIVLVIVAMFVGLWLLLLWTQGRKKGDDS